MNITVQSTSVASNHVLLTVTALSLRVGFLPGGTKRSGKLQWVTFYCNFLLFILSTSILSYFIITRTFLAQRVTSLSVYTVMCHPL